MDVPTFIAKWNRAKLSEKAASQEHFLDLCALCGVKTPAELDPVGDTFTFEKSVAVENAASLGSKGERGFADVWYKGKFVWEYKRKGKYKDLADAYRQVNQYRGALGNPPLLIVSDIHRTEIHTNFTGFKPERHMIELDDLNNPESLSILRRIFTDPESFKPTETPEEVTKKVAEAIGSIAQGLRDKGTDPHDAAHFLMKVMFCLFAEDVELLPKKLFETMLNKYHHEPTRLKTQMDALFDAMRTGGDFGIEEIAYFNGGLFDTDPAIELTEEDISHLAVAASKDWSVVEPSVFGTLFERSLDPAKRAQIGAHYTSRDDIMLVIEPVILRPLKKEWDETQTKIAEQLERRRAAKTAATKKKADAEIANLFDGFQHRLASVRVLDPACGSGNFLYVAIQCLLDLEREVIVAASSEEIGMGGLLPRVRPSQLLGIEINPYASELAQVVIWIGYLQWMRDNGFNTPKDPILENIDTIDQRDAILSWEDEEGNAIPVWREGAVCRGQAEWPEADFIVGNPPFLGGSTIRAELGDSYTNTLFASYSLPNASDLCCYWFELAQNNTAVLRCGLLATQGIRGGVNRVVLEKICAVHTIFDAWSDLPWLLDGAAVRISIVCFSKHHTQNILLDGNSVTVINPDLTCSIDTTTAIGLLENEKIGFRGNQKGGDFDIDYDIAQTMLADPNAAAGTNLDVLTVYKNGMDVSRRSRGMWLVDFGLIRDLASVSLYQSPIAYVEKNIKPKRLTNRRETYRKYWWIHNEPRPSMREALKGTERFACTLHVSKHRMFVWLSSDFLPDHQLCVFARSDDYFFGVLHSSVHELWARRQGTQLEDRPRYTPTTCFETFPLPWPPGSEPGEGDENRDLHDAIGAAAADLNTKRERWLNPPEWVEEIAAAVDEADDFDDVLKVSGPEAQRLIRQSAIDAASAKDKRLKKRTLTNLYNERPTWLRLAHKALDEAVLAAYAAVDAEGSWDASQAEVFVQTGAGQALPETAGTEGGEDAAAPTPHPLAEKREEVEQQILGDLLRMNLARASEE